MMAVIRYGVSVFWVAEESKIFAKYPNARLLSIAKRGVMSIRAQPAGASLPRTIAGILTNRMTSVSMALAPPQFQNSRATSQVLGRITSCVQSLWHALIFNECAASPILTESDLFCSVTTVRGGEREGKPLLLTT